MSHKLTKHQLRSVKKTIERHEQYQARRELRAQRLSERRDRRRAPRKRDWHDSDDAATYEKIRRARSEAPPTASTGARVVEGTGITGTVIEVRVGEAVVSVGGHAARAVLTPGARVLAPDARSPLAVGDRVRLEPVSPDVTRIVAIEPRRSALVRDAYDPTRRDPVAKGHVIAANIDQVVVVCSLAEPPFRPRLLDRYLVAASRDALPAVICLNKTDLGVDGEVERMLAGYECVGVGIVRASAALGDVDALRECIAGKVSLFSGHSGVGKSSLLNALEPGLALNVGAVTQAKAGQGKGRHTTSTARLVPLSLPETFVVDSPGIRAFGIKGLDPHALASHFADIATLGERCAYRDCLHRGERGCAVAAQATDDWFLRLRLESYRLVLGEL